MKNVKPTNKTLYDYIKEAKSDMILYFVILGILIIVQIILYILYGIPVSICFLFLVLAHLLFTTYKITSYNNVLKINKYLINNQLENKIGNIIFWNEKDYFLTDNYILLVIHFKVNCIDYKEIKTISKRMEIIVNKHSGANEYLTIELRNNKKYDILIWTTYLIGEEYKDISEFLIEKNPEIEVNYDREKYESR